MTRFHTDEYVHFLSRVTPETAEDLTFHGTRCTSLSLITLGFTDIFSQSWLVKITQLGKGFSTFVPCLQEVQ